MFFAIIIAIILFVLLANSIVIALFYGRKKIEKVLNYWVFLGVSYNHIDSDKNLYHKIKSQRNYKIAGFSKQKRI